MSVSSLLPELALYLAKTARHPITDRILCFHSVSEISPRFLFSCHNRENEETTRWHLQVTERNGNAVFTATHKYNPRSLLEGNNPQGGYK
jgi:hypothetical protein